MITKELENYVINLRRHLHMYPEISGQEIETTNKIKEELIKEGIEFQELENNCIVAKIKGKEGRKIALRADSDALPVKEEGEHKCYISKNDGIMHACGHDGHVAMLLGAGKYLNSIRDELNGTVYLCFQSAEEIGGGAKEILEYLESEGGVDEVLGIHLWSLIPIGKIAVSEGARMANGDGFEIEVSGRGGHGSRPDQCVNPLKIGARILLDISSIPSNQISTLDPSVVSVGKFTGGSARNVIPSRAVIEGGIRTFTEEARREIPILIKRIAENTAEAHGGRAIVKIKKGVPCVYNHMLSSKRAKETVTKILGPEAVYEFEPLCASENFGFYTQKYQGLMAFVGAGNEKKGIIYPHHHPMFDIDEDALANGTALYAQYAIDFLN